jgi:hypothetical protein
MIITHAGCFGGLLGKYTGDRGKLLAFIPAFETLVTELSICYTPEVVIVDSRSRA